MGRDRQNVKPGRPGQSGAGLGVRITCLSALRRGERGWLGAGRREGGLGWSLGGSVGRARALLEAVGVGEEVSPPLED